MTIHYLIKAVFRSLTKAICVFCSSKSNPFKRHFESLFVVNTFGLSPRRSQILDDADQEINAPQLLNVIAGRDVRNQLISGFIRFADCNTMPFCQNRCNHVTGPCSEADIKVDSRDINRRNGLAWLGHFGSGGRLLVRLNFLDGCERTILQPTDPFSYSVRILQI
jgi:hypothetical protein